MIFFMWLGIGYLLGSIPFGLLLVRAGGGGDLREIGSGNIGATNVMRTGNKSLALATLLLDGSKGAIVIAAASMTLPDAQVGSQIGPQVGWIGFAAVFGHCFPVWLRFRGGKGVATGFASIAALNIIAGGIMIATWLMIARFLRISSLAALSGYAAALVYVALTRPDQSLPIAAIILLSAARHHQNIARLLKGEEGRFAKK